MKAVLVFELPEERVEHLWAVRGADMACAISGALEEMRGWLKYGHKFETPEEAIEACRGLFEGVAETAWGDGG